LNFQTLSNNIYADYAQEKGTRIMLIEIKEFIKTYKNEILEYDTENYILFIYPRTQEAINFFGEDNRSKIIEALVKGENISHLLPDEHIIGLQMKKDMKFYLCRDYFGKIPLFWKIKESKFYFDISLKNLREDEEICLSGINFFLSLQYIPAPYTIWKGISKIFAGQVLVVEQQSKSAISRKFSNKASHQPLLEAIDDCYSDINMYDKELCFLSGGLDSSINIYFLKKHGHANVWSVNASFSDSNFNQTKNAQIM